MRESSMWTKVTRVKDGGGHVYISKEMLEASLADAKLDPACKELEVCFHLMRRANCKAGSIHARIRPIRKVENNGPV